MIILVGMGSTRTIVREMLSSVAYAADNRTSALAGELTVCSDFFVNCCSVEPPPIDVSIFGKWQDQTLQYLWRVVEVTCRIWFVVQRRSDPRWSGKRWKAKT